MKTVAVFLLFLAGSWAHLCLISPPQRGSMFDINKPASPDCGLTTGPCGQRPALNKTTVVFLSGSRYTVTIQKNLDHYDSSSPGEFTISFRPSRKGGFTLLEKIPDNGEPSLTLYSVNITIPKPTAHSDIGTLQAAYVTRNPQAPPVFYQCTDFFIEPL
ncbi:uncharacterized protein LOC118403890 [Branchiostoma floridae]|uniref:Uncharacterized protein LOC118403890 n=1 Tax=Branchiostoma floridae TaxID=7739 RepID=A0A9J7HJZ3_BRAFL|nr:uncharacterized protein LOC118403890 [Branchiostoma floridae]